MRAAATLLRLGLAPAVSSTRPCARTSATSLTRTSATRKDARRAGASPSSWPSVGKYPLNPRVSACASPLRVSARTSPLRVSARTSPSACLAGNVTAPRVSAGTPSPAACLRGTSPLAACLRGNVSAPRVPAGTPPLNARVAAGTSPLDPRVSGTWAAWSYLAVVLDMLSRRVAGWPMR